MILSIIMVHPLIIRLERTVPTAKQKFVCLAVTKDKVIYIVGTVYREGEGWCQRDSDADRETHISHCCSVNSTQLLTASRINILRPITVGKMYFLWIVHILTSLLFILILS